jgi:uncharacterized protein (TIGR03382 family)
MIREGMEDFEYLKLLSDAGDPELARSIARQVFPNPYSTDVDPAVLARAREAMAVRIVQLGGGELPGEGGGGCSSAGGGAAALLAFPVLLGLALVRRRGRG